MHEIGWYARILDIVPARKLSNRNVSQKTLRYLFFSFSSEINKSLETIFQRSCVSFFSVMLSIGSTIQYLYKYTTTQYSTKYIMARIHICRVGKPWLDYWPTTLSCQTIQLFPTWCGVIGAELLPSAIQWNIQSTNGI